MSSKEQEFRKRLLATFKVEAAEHLQSLSSGLLELENNPSVKPAPVLEAIFRAAHSLKGSARAVNLSDVERICHTLESVLAALKRQELILDTNLFDPLHEVMDHLARLVFSDETQTENTLKPQSAACVQRLEIILNQSPSEAAPPQPAAKTDEPLLSSVFPTAETLRISAKKLDSLFLQTEELLFVKQAAAQRTADLKQLQLQFESWTKRWSKVQGSARAVEALTRSDPSRAEIYEEIQPKLAELVEFTRWSGSFVKSIEQELPGLTQSAEQHQRALATMVDTLLTDIKAALTLPFSSILEGFPKMVRDLARDQGKDIGLLIYGAELAIDRKVLEEIKEPLIHALRNAVDHGIETPRDRQQKGKPTRGQIVIEITRKDSSKAEISLRDDGAGIDCHKLRAAALKAGAITPAEAEQLDNTAVLNLAFRSGVSTSSILTDISGRGLGLAILRERVERLGGTVSVETTAGAGSTFRFLLPLTRAAFRGVLVRSGDALFVFPTTYVERVARVPQDQVRTVENRRTIQIDGQNIALVALRDALGISMSRPAATEKIPQISLVVVNCADKRLAFAVDQILHEQEVLLKNLGRQLGSVQNISGATLLADGRVVPILDLPELVQSAIRASGPTGISEEEPRAAAKAVLVAEDSITARTLLKNILESANYTVTTAVDGLDAFTKLREGAFDLVISDVEMPRMNGFELTSKIRADKRLTEVPVVLVTALESREDRERGIDVGANAYIVKSSFDQSNLLEVVRRFV